MNAICFQKLILNTKLQSKTAVLNVGADPFFTGDCKMKSFPENPRKMLSKRLILNEKGQKKEYSHKANNSRIVRIK